MFSGRSPMKRKKVVVFSETQLLKLHLCKNYICAASRNTRDRIMLIRAKHRTIV